MRATLMIRYVLGEMIPTFFLGVFAFVFILLMFQALRLTEFVLIHGVAVSVVTQMMAYFSMSVLPVLFPMSLLFTVLLTYGRLSADSEIVAFRAAGLSMWSIITPAVIVSILVGVLSLQTSFHLAPWGNRQFEVLITQAGASKPGVVLKEGTFAEGFFDLVVYANKVDSKLGKLSQVFIYNERDPKTPVTIIAREGLLLQDAKHPGNQASLRLIDGNIHRVSEGHHTKIDFSTYDIFLSDPVKEGSRDKSAHSLTLEEINERLGDPSLKNDVRLELQTEYHRRVAIAFACVLFALIGVGLGTNPNRRSAKSGGAVMSLGLIIFYYILYVASESAALKGQIQPAIAMWLANGLFSIAALWSLRRAWR